MRYSMLNPQITKNGSDTITTGSVLINEIINFSHADVLVILSVYQYKLSSAVTTRNDYFTTFSSIIFFAASAEPSIVSTWS